MEQPVVEAHLGLLCVGRAEPVQRALDLAPVGGAAAAACGVVAAAQFGDFAVAVFDDILAGDVISVFQPHLAPRRQPEKLFRRLLHEVAALDDKFARERQFARAGGGIVRVVGGLHFLDAAFRVVVNHDFQRLKHRHRARRRFVQFVAHAGLQRVH